MKRQFAVVLFGVSSFVLANQPADNTVAQPMVSLEVYDLSKKEEPKMLEGRVLSRSNKHHYLCWTAVNVGATEEKLNMSIEKFESPMSIRISDSAGNDAQRRKDGKEHLFLSLAETKQNNIVERCWQFSSKYPVGEYRLTLRVNEFEFPTQTFNIAR